MVNLLKINFALFLSLNLHAGTFTSNSAAYFVEDEVRVSVASNTDCSNAGTDKDELLTMIAPAIDEYWNTVSTSRLTLVSGGEYTTTDTNFNTARLCNADTDDTCPDDNTIIPRVNHIVITCNADTSSNFSTAADQQNIYAITLSNHVNGSNIKGSVIIINNTNPTPEANPFSGLSYAEKVAVLSHEIGHAVGIGHTPIAENLMYFTPTPRRFALGPDDAMALTYLYPKKFDGCGLLSTTNVNDDKNNFLMNFLISFLFFIGIGVVLKKFFFKFQKAILQYRFSRLL